MQSVKNYNLLIIGRSGSGKSATTKLLTGNPEIKVANSLKQVTTQVNYHEGTSIDVGGQEVRFRILDIPGLDKIKNRAIIRQNILTLLETKDIALHAIVYVSSLTQRDTIDQSKLFGFLQQLPWSLQQKRNALIPIFTKYDNLIIDSQQEDILSTKNQFKQIFDKCSYSLAWSKRIYWVNHTKSLQFKIKSYQDIREKYEKQIERLIQVIKRNKNQLTARAIRQIISIQDSFILKKVFQNFENEVISFKKQVKSHQITLKIHVQATSIEQSLTTLSASSIGMFISKVCQKSIAKNFSFIMMAIPIAVTLLKLAADSFILYSKGIGQNNSGESIMNSYEHICNELNKQLEKQWKQFNQQLQFKVVNKKLCCQVTNKFRYKFFDLTKMDLLHNNILFEKSINESYFEFLTPLPYFQQELIWSPQILVTYEVKKFSQEQLLKSIQGLRKDFCSKI